MSIRVLLAEDHVLVRQGLRSLLEREGFQVVGEASNGGEAARLAASTRPDVAVLNIAMPVMNGIEACGELRRASPDTRVVILSMYSDDQYVMSALKAGVSGYVLKSRAAGDLVHAIREASLGGFTLSPGISRAVVEAHLANRGVPPDPLTPRERQILQLVAEGKSTKEAAAALNISVKTADTHRNNLMRKLGAHSAADLVRHAVRRGLVQV